MAPLLVYLRRRKKNPVNYQNVKVSLWDVFLSACSLQLTVSIMVCCILLWYNRSMPLWHLNTIWYRFIFWRCRQGYMLLSACCFLRHWQTTLVSYSNGKPKGADVESQPLQPMQVSGWTHKIIPPLSKGLIEMGERSLSHVVWHLCRLLGLKPRLGGKKGCFPNRQHETPRNIYWGSQGATWQLAKSNSSPEWVRSVWVQPWWQNPSLLKRQVSSSRGNSLESSGISGLGRIYKFIMGI